MDKYFVILLVLLSAVILMLLFSIINKKRELEKIKGDISEKIEKDIESLGNTISSMQTQVGQVQDTRIKDLTDYLYHSNEVLYKAVNDNLDRMRTTVDEKLENTLNTRLTKSFSAVNERLEQVYKGLGQMQNLAEGVGDLKKVLSNVKTRGILGELQLGNLLSEIMAPGQYIENTPTFPGSSDRVEFAVKFPGSGEEPILLPIDSKFPQDIYVKLLEAREDNEKDISAAEKEMTKTMKVCAKTIRDKYVKPPYTTDFAIMFLPFEGLYAEVIRLGLVEMLQRDYKINIAGPTTMAVLLNSLQLGFKTVAIEKRTSEVWKLLSAVKTEFSTFASVLEKTQERLNQANSELDKLVGVRTRKIQSSLNKVGDLSTEETEILLSGSDGDNR